MKLQRSLTSIGVGCLVGAAWLAAVRAAPPAEDEYFVYVGSYTDAPSTSQGIYGWRVSPSSRAGPPPGLFRQTANPAYVHATPAGKFLFSANWPPADAAKADPVN